MLVAIWEEILKRSPIGVHDNFFDVGGHSLLAVSLFGRLEREFGRRLPLASLFQNPTIVQLASLLETDSKHSTRWDSLVCIRHGGEGPAVFIVHGAGGNILIYRDLARHLTARVSVYGLQSLGLDGHKRPLGTIEEMALSYVDEIMRQQPVGPYVLAGYCMGGKVALEMARLLEERGQSVAMLAMLDSFNFNVANAASFRRSKLSSCFQLVSFHARNLFALGPRGMWPYVSEKARLAREAVAGAIVLDEVARRENLDVSNDELDGEIGRYAERTGRTPAAVRARLEKEGGVSRVYAGLRREKSIDFLMARATISGA